MDKTIFRGTGSQLRKIPFITIHGCSWPFMIIHDVGKFPNACWFMLICEYLWQEFVGIPAVPCGVGPDPPVADGGSRPPPSSPGGRGGLPSSIPTHLPYVELPPSKQRSASGEGRATPGQGGGQQRRRWPRPPAAPLGRRHPATEGRERGQGGAAGRLSHQNCSPLPPPPACSQAGETPRERCDPP